MKRLDQSKDEFRIGKCIVVSNSLVRLELLEKSHYLSNHLKEASKLAMQTSWGRALQQWEYPMQRSQMFCIFPMYVPYISVGWSGNEYL